MTLLSPAQKKHLRGLSHKLKPIVRIGKNGLTDRVLASLDEALESHELVKVKMAADRVERRRLAQEIDARLESTEVGAIGHVAVFFRPARDPEKRRLRLPEAGVR